MSDKIAMLNTIYTRMIRIVVVIVVSLSASLPAMAWSDHPIIAKYSLKDFVEWDRMDSVEAKSLQQFLLQSGTALESFLDQQELRMRAILPHYAPRPGELAFVANGDSSTLVERFLHAIRLNPNSKIPLYLFVLPGDATDGRTIADPALISTLRDLESMRNSVYVWINEGEAVHPFDVLTTANNEPDYGFDLGLFEDNQTDYGVRYGFGVQPFGNPNLEYSSQAPFHMGFYHEAKILYAAGPFLRHTFLDYRAELFRELSIFAFEQEQPYWGWRFMGWSMHYAADANMPYHCKPLPGYSVLRMIWINLKAMLGFTKSRDNAVQLVSNKHTIIEEYQWQELRRAHQANESEHPFIKALQQGGDIIDFNSDFVREVASRRAVAQSREFDRVIKRNMPSYMVSDSRIEVSQLPEISRIAEIVAQQNGGQSTDELNRIIADRFTDVSLSIRSLMLSVFDQTGMAEVWVASINK